MEEERQLYDSRRARVSALVGISEQQPAQRHQEQAESAPAARFGRAQPGSCRNRS